MSDLIKKEIPEITPEEQVLYAHQYLKDFLDKFNDAKRGGIHDFIELTIYTMLGDAVENIDNYLSTGHKQVVASEIMTIITDSFQGVLDGVKRNLDNAKQVNFQ